MRTATMPTPGPAYVTGSAACPCVAPLSERGKQLSHSVPDRRHGHLPTVARHMVVRLRLCPKNQRTKHLWPRLAGLQSAVQSDQIAVRRNIRLGWPINKGEIRTFFPE